MTRAEIEAKIAELRAENEAAPGWGAAVGARHEHIKELERQLRALDAQPASAIENLITNLESSTVALARGFATVPLAAIAPARAEWERQKINNYAARNYAERASRELNNYNIELSRLRAEFAKARAPIMVTPAAYGAAVAAHWNTGSTPDALDAALPHLHPARLPTEEEIARIIAENVWVETASEFRCGGADDAARAILALLRAPGGGE